MAKFYELETPVAVTTEGGIFEYYTEAKRCYLILGFHTHRNLFYI